MEILILTGMSGSGKSVAVNSLEDTGFFCIDNLPPQLLADLILKLAKANVGTETGIDRLAVVVDSRSAEFFPVLADNLRMIESENYPFKVLFLDASNQTLLSRYKQTRRNHPLADRGGSLLSGIENERNLLKPLREKADMIIKTDNMKPIDLARAIYKTVEETVDETKRISVIVQSFGFKYGVPEDSDIVTDVRFLPNPFYIDDLRPLSGQDKEIRDYVYGFPETQTYMEKQVESLLFLLPFYIREGKTILTVSVGCTGGRHRSVLLAGDLAKQLKQHNYRVTLIHRDIAKDLQK